MINKAFCSLVNNDAQLATAISTYKQQFAQLHLAFDGTIQRQFHTAMHRLLIVVHSFHCSEREVMRRRAVVHLNEPIAVAWDSMTRVDSSVTKNTVVLKQLTSLVET